MTITHHILRSYTPTSGITRSFSESVSGNAEVDINESALASAIVNKQYGSFAFAQSALRSVEIYASAPVTLYTNAPSSGSPQDMIHLVAGQVLVWTLETDGLSRCPFSNNVTSLYVTNPNSFMIQLEINVLLVE